MKITRYGDNYGELARVATRGGHGYIVRTTPAFEPGAGEKTWIHVGSRREAIEILTEEYCAVEEGSADWYEEEG